MKMNYENTLCMAIDIQEKLMPAIEDHKALEKSMQNLLEGLKILEVPVIFTEQYPKGLGKTLDEIKGICPTSVTVEKTQFSAWLPEVQSRLNSLNRNHIILFGVETHVCVYQTALDLLEQGYQVYLPADCVGSRTAFNRDNALEDLARRGATITNRETLLFQLLENAKNPHFKTISALVK